MNKERTVFARSVFAEEQLGDDTLRYRADVIVLGNGCLRDSEFARGLSTT